MKLLVTILLLLISGLMAIGTNDLLSRQRSTETNVVTLTRDVASLKEAQQSNAASLNRIEEKQDKLLDMLIQHEKEGRK